MAHGVRFATKAPRTAERAGTSATVLVPLAKTCAIASVAAGREFAMTLMSVGNVSSVPPPAKALIPPAAAADKHSHR